MAHHGVRFPKTPDINMDRVTIGRNYENQPAWKRYVGVPLIYLPLIATLPFVLLGVLLVRIHLRFVGGTNIRSFWSFAPDWASHRYIYDNQITYQSETTRFQLRSFRWYWIFNCKLYCPLSVALFRYMAYLVMVVENWWCPFKHSQKHEYAVAAIDQSYWHLHEVEVAKLHPDDSNNAIWNDQAEPNKAATE